jgi:hypothetical protein
MKGILDGPDGKPILFVGDDSDDAEAVKRGYAILSACKDGPRGHRAALRYTTMGAPKDENYYHATRGKRMVLNLLDLKDPDFIPEDAIFPALKFIDKHLKAGDKVLVHCNAGRSRSPSVGLAYLRAIGEMPYSFRTAEKVFKSLYPSYSPGNGMRTFVREHWVMLEKFLKDNFHATE